MRRIMNVFKEYHKISLQKFNWPNATTLNKKLLEIDQMYTFIDNNLSGVMFGNRGNIQDIDGPLQEVMTSADFSFAIMEFVDRKLWPGYTQQEFQFEQLVFMDTVTNFLPVTRYQSRAELDDLEYVGSKGEARPGSKDDAVKRQYRVVAWEKQYDFSFQNLVNDELGYFSNQAVEMGRSARRTLEKFVSRMIFNATNIARLTALGALFSTNGRLTTDRISTARMAFAQRVDDRNEPMNANLEFIVHHTGLGDTVDVIRQSTLIPELATNAKNVIANRFTPIKNPYLAGVAPNLPWMAMGDPNGIENVRGLVLARRAGVPGPQIWRKKGNIESFSSFGGGGTSASPMWGDFETGNIMVKVHDEWGTFIDETDGNMVDTRGFYHSTGTAA